MSRFVTYLPRQVRHRACVLGGSAAHGRCQAHFAKRPKTIFSNQTSPKNSQNVWRNVVRRSRCNAFAIARFVLLLTRGVAPRDLHLWLPRGTSQNAIFSNKKKQKMLIICQIDWSEVEVAVELQCLRNCTLSSFILFSY